MEIVSIPATPEDLCGASRTPEFDGLIDATVTFLAERNLPEELTMNYVERRRPLPIRRYELALLPGVSPHMSAVRRGDRSPVYTIEADLPFSSNIRHVGMVAAKYSFPLNQTGGLPMAPRQITSLEYRTTLAKDCPLAGKPEACWHHHSLSSVRDMGLSGAIQTLTETLLEMNDGELFTNTFSLSWVSIPSLR